MHQGVLLWLSALIWCSTARIPFYEDVKYNEGVYGKYVSQKFKSNPDVKAPVINFMKPFSACDDGSYIFITPRGHIVDPQAVILDVNGSVVWSTTRDYGKIYDLRVQQYKGKPHLTFWAGSDVVEGHGVGYHYILDQNYAEVFKFTGSRKSGTDLHVFTITPQNSAIFLYYNATLADTSSLSSWRVRGYVWDSVLLEIDLDTEDVLFKWNSLDHMNLTESTVDLNAASPEAPYDAFHLNSVFKDSHGNYLLSFRYTNSILYIDGKTGAVLWQLGGKSNQFKDLSGGNATKFAGQHDVQWVSEGHVLTFFDNMADWYHEIGKNSRGVRIKIDTDAMTAELEQEFVNTNRILSASQGSYQTLPNGNVLLGYGFNAVFTEFSPKGEVLCDAYFQPSSTFGSGNVQSYAAKKFKWSAQPNSDPDIFLESKERKLHMSWNGCTGFTQWSIQGTSQEIEPGADSDNSNVFRELDIISKTGFETEYTLDITTDIPRYLRVVGLDAKGKPLGFSKTVDVGKLSGLKNSTQSDTQSTDKEGGWRLTMSPASGDSSAFRIGSFVAMFVAALILMRFGRRRIFGLLRRVSRL